jgi:hypothetical protein
MNRILTLIFSLSCVCTSAISLPTQFLISPVFAQPARRDEPLSDVDITKIAKNITVRIFNKDQKGKECSASGFIVNKKVIKSKNSDNQPQVYEYQVLTNNHVVNGLAIPYQIQTTDNKIYTATIVKSVNFEDNDLALLTFNSSVEYKKYTLGNSSTLQAGNKVFVAGFPGEMSACDQSKFTIKSGVVAPLEILLNGKTLIGGYAIGYDNDTKRGSSGGPVLNDLGEVVAVNGKGKYSKPPFANTPDPYKFNDNTEPDQNIKLLMTYFSWGIPIETYVKTIDPNSSTGENKPALKEEGKKKYSTIQSSGQETVTGENQGYHPLILLGLGITIVGFFFVAWKSFFPLNSQEDKAEGHPKQPVSPAKNPSDPLKPTTQREEVAGDAAVTQKTTDEKIEEDSKYDQLDEIPQKMIDLSLTILNYVNDSEKISIEYIVKVKSNGFEETYQSICKKVTKPVNTN